MDSINTYRITDGAETESYLNRFKRETETKIEQPIVQKKEPQNNENSLVDNEKMASIAHEVNEYLKSIQTNLEVEIHKETNTAVFKIVRKDDHKVLLEVPPKELLDISVKIRDMVGSLVDDNA
jgi:flagellar protein FlaG